MKKFLSILSLFIICTVAYPQDGQNDNPFDPTQSIIKVLTNWAAYYGFDITKPPAEKVTGNLIFLAMLTALQQNIYNTNLGSIPVNASAQNNSFKNFIPDNGDPSAAAFNNFANKTFANYSSPSQNTVSYLPNIDQTAQKDPVSQMIVDLLETPNFTYCMNADQSAWANKDGSCSYLYSNLITQNIMGIDANNPPPGIFDFFSDKYNKNFISQLNSNNLLGPLLYTTSNDNSGGTSSSTPTKQVGLPAQTQAQQADDFIRYVSGSVTPLDVVSQVDYANAYSAFKDATNVKDQQQAFATLVGYLATLRTYAAQSSVGFSNLYYMLSRRMPQTGADNKTITSDALSEYNMASWRLINNNDQNSWLNKINTASSESVQKEIAALLAEMNYQLYLTRQQQERMLLTETVLLMQVTKFTQPKSNAFTEGNPYQK